MSIYSSSTTWTCPTSDQSPINLSQASSKPCDLLCELVMDDAMIAQANVLISDEGLILQNTAGLGSCKYNGEGYTCNLLLVNHPSHHTIENIQADGEVIAVFTNPTGKYLCVSSLFRVNPAETPSTHFFNSFIPYANASQQYVPVNLGENWNLSMMVPPNGAHYVYDGSMVAPPCQPAKWVVFKSMINIDANTFALLVRIVAPGSRPVQAVGTREVFFNDIEHLAGTPMGQGDKKYMRCRKAGAPTKAVKQVASSPLKEQARKNTKNIAERVVDYTTSQVQTNGYMYYFSGILTILSLGVGLYAGSKMFFIGLYILNFFQNLPSFVYRFFMFFIMFFYNYIWYPLTKKPETTA
jgi:carbonic anhydrase